MTHDCGNPNDTALLIATATLASGRAGTFAALRSLSANTDPAIRYAYERLYRAFGHALRQRTDTTVIKFPTIHVRCLVASEHTRN